MGKDVFNEKVSLLEAIEKKDMKLVDEIEKRAKKGETIRLI